MIREKLYFGGFRFDEAVMQSSKMEVVRSDAAIFVISWEDRSFEILKKKKCTGADIFLISFQGDGVRQARKDKFANAAKLLFDNVHLIEFPNPLEFEETMSATEELAQRIASLNALSCTVDYSSLPKVVTQTLFRGFMIEGVCPRVHWIYGTGLYDGTPAADGTLDQGVDQFFSIRGAEGRSISTQRVGILAIGSERQLISAFHRANSYDKIYYLCARTAHSPVLMQRVEEKQKWLRDAYGASGDDFIDCATNSPVQALRAFKDIIDDDSIEDGCAIDLFCSGPKSHAIAASALTSMHENVCLVARSPKTYKRLNVKSSGEFSITTLSDFTNPLIAKTLLPIEEC